MDEDARRALAHLVEAVEVLQGAVWHVINLSKHGDEAKTPYIAVLAENPMNTVTEKLNAAKLIIEAPD